MTALREILATYRVVSQTEREKGAYFEELIRTYLRHEPTYADLYSDVWSFSDWASETMQNPKYPLELLQRVITVSMETNKIVNALPSLDID